MNDENYLKSIPAVFDSIWESADKAAKKEYPDDTLKQADARQKHICEMLTMLPTTESCNIGSSIHTGEKSIPKNDNCWYVDAFFLGVGLIVFIIIILIIMKLFVI